MKFNQRQKNAALFGAIGLLTLVLCSFVDISFGKTSVSRFDAWQQGLIQPYLFGGAALSVFSYLYFRGENWPRWPILVWYPVVFGIGAYSAEQKGFISIDLLRDIVLGWLPVSIAWVYGVWVSFFKRENSTNVT